MRRAISILVSALLISASSSWAQPLSVAAASDLQAVLPELTKSFEAEFATEVRLTFGSSGNFHAQIRNGAPFDVFMSADLTYPRRLIEEGKADESSLYPYAIGQLVLWARRDAPVDLRRGLQGLTDRGVTRIAVANPAHAPYGRAALAAFEATGVLEHVRGKLVLGENASQTAQFVQSGNASVGLLPLALALSPALTAGQYVVVPAHLYPPLLQGAVIVSASRHKSAAERFLAFLKRDSTMTRLSQAGFLRP